MKMKPHPQAEWIKAKADGHTVQERGLCSPWEDMPEDNFTFNSSYQYRIKPAEPEKVYPVTNIPPSDLYGIWNKGAGDFTDIANAAIRRAIDDGQVVIVSELGKNDLARHERDLSIAEAVRNVYRKHLAGPFSNVDNFSPDLYAIIAGVK